MIFSILLLNLAEVRGSHDNRQLSESSANDTTSKNTTETGVPALSALDESQIAAVQAQYGNGKVSVSVDSIEPEGGPITGETRVLVRGGPFELMKYVYESPKCKFGKNDRVVDATYVTCTEAPTSTEGKEAHHNERQHQCLQCDNSPSVNDPEIVAFTVSLTGDFADSANSLPFRYYNNSRVYAIKPRYGPKDGETRVEIWGENFLNYDELTRCNFGSKSVVAKYYSSTYMVCIAPSSDVVQKKISFSVSLNKQQNSRDDIEYWYYNWNAINELVPNYGPDAGGNVVLLKGQNFNPFKEEAIDNNNDTFCNFEGIGKVKATIINSTKATCVAPPNYLLDMTYIEMTLNDQQYTDDNNPYYYYRPPQIFDVDPREGPVKGGTLVTVIGSNIKDNKNITCKFGQTLTTGKYIDANKILCTSPPTDRPGYVDLSIAYQGEKYTSETVKYLYYETPELYNITPTCGPVTGYTQITVQGKNFLNMGFGKVKCIFNDTIYMNATILEDDIIKCDSPPLSQSMGFSESGASFYYVEITLNGKEITNSTDPKLKFIYYVNPLMKNITTYKGPLQGGTKSKIYGKGFKQEGVCNMTVRYGAIQQKIHNWTDTLMNATSPKAKIPGSVVVSISPNGQQFIDDKTLHFRDTENTFTYYQDFFVIDYSPKSGPTSGKTLVKTKGLGFDQFKNDDGSIIDEPLYARFIDSTNMEQIGDIQKVFDNDGEEFKLRTPKAAQNTKAIYQLSFNAEDWQDIIPGNSTYSYLYYDAPKITSISPAYGPVKSPNNETILISGENFNCPDTDCTDLYVRFGDPKNGIYVKGTKNPNGTVSCRVPKYTKPDVLPVEITFNGQDYTNDNKTYGFFDPYILDVQPRLISTKGTTKVRLYGFGFVNSTGTDLKTKINSNKRGALSCSGDCVKMATYIDKSTIETPTFKQSQVTYSDNGDNIEFNGMAIEGCVYGSTYTENHIEIFYYDDPIYQTLSSYGSPQNLQMPLYVKTDFNLDVNDKDMLNKYANFTFRYTSKTDPTRVFYSKARMVTQPLGYEGTGSGNMPDSSGNMPKGSDKNVSYYLKSDTPQWPLTEAVTLDYSVNGQDFSGGHTFNFYDPLDVYRTVPMSGPNEGGTKVKLYGSGFNTQKEDVWTRWGVINTDKQVKEDVLEYIWNENDFISHAMVDGCEILQAYKKEAFNVEKYDYEIVDATKLKTYQDKSPRMYDMCAHSQGGPVYISVGERLVLNVTNNTYVEGENTTEASYYNKTVNVFSNSFVEYYYYETPVIKKVEPKSGLTKGGTLIEISGAWFKYMPEYGIVPHCKIGDKVSRAQYFSTVRIVCEAPPNEDMNQMFAIYVSLNGMDWTDTGYKFHYYEQPVLYKMTPICGPDTGGTQIYITGAKFSNISDPENFKCRFTDLEMDIPPKYIPAYYENQTTIMCSSPGGWGRGDAARVQVTFNGEDYSENNFTFYYYNIQKANPRSGPSDGSGDPILIIGSGFRNDTPIFCSLDKVLYEPLEITNTSIKCPMVPAKNGPTWFGTVDFSVVIDGNWHKFQGGYQYYEQPTLEDMYPHIGPSEGKGIVYFYGQKFRDDFELANVGCKIGDVISKGTVTNGGTTIKCIIDEELLVDEGQTLPASVALNSYSWVDSNQTFVPYGINQIYPNSGPIAGNTDVLVVGKGFSEDLAEKARCKFGVNSNFAIVQAEILSYDKLICRSPPDYQGPSTADQTISIPLGVAFLEDDFAPFTESVHRYRYYPHPSFLRADPDEIYVGKMSEVIVIADDNADLFEPIPTQKGSQGNYGIQCKFGRFGVGQGSYVNKTAIKCLTPSVSDDPDSIWRESVKITLALNGQDYDEENSDVDFTFIGTGSSLVFWPYVISTLLIGLLLVAIIVLCVTCIQKIPQVVKKQEVPQNDLRVRNRPYVIRDPYDQFTSRAYVSGMMGRQSAAE